MVELSIVLLVIGLLVSGVLVGKDMIRAAELRSITTQKDQLQTSVMLFQDKYHGLPGDLKNATAFWGEMGAINGGTGVCNNTAAGASGATGTQTCNGNGNGKITDSWSTVIGSNDEITLFWQHLSNAGLIEGKYSGAWSGIWGVDGQDMAGKVKNTFWHSVYRGILTEISILNFFEGDYGNTLEIFSTGLGNNVLTPTEMWGIDKKIDDGMPGLGSVVALEIDGVDCNNVAASPSPIAATATYNLSNELISCQIIFKNMW